MVKRWKVTIPSLTGDRERTAFCYLPVGYNARSKKRYPVIYMFDGHNLFTDEEATFGKCWGLEDYLDFTDTPVIIAAVECNTEGNGRLSEYSPISFDFRGERIVGRGKKYMDWLVGYFKPYIDAHFATLPDRANTYIAGSSMGGLMTMYALANYNKHFSKGAALSPSLWIDGKDLPAFIEKGRYGKDTVLYMDYGSKEFSNHEKQREAFGKAFDILLKKNVFVTARVVPYGVHSEASWEQQIPYFMHTLGF
jgi:predicted alpha/beta superfamily hydrolase